MGAGYSSADVRAAAEELCGFNESGCRVLQRPRPGVPRIRYWQLWIEANLSIFLAPVQGEATRLPSNPSRNPCSSGAALIVKPETQEEFAGENAEAS